jgi:hypothetical protein
MRVRRRFWTELGLAVASALMLLLTGVWPDWIEVISGLDPDGGDGSLEWAIVVVLVVFAVTLPLMARREWRRAHPAASTPGS